MPQIYKSILLKIMRAMQAPALRHNFSSRKEWSEPEKNLAQIIKIPQMFNSFLMEVAGKLTRTL
jgi:hypothetical protein